MELRQIAKDVYACLQEDKGLGTSNSGLINRGGGLVVDTFWDLPHTRAMIDLYAGVWPAPPRRVVNTHHNGDHCWGNQLFAGAEIIGHRLCAAHFGKEQPQTMQMMAGLASSSDPTMAALGAAFAGWDFSGIELTPPTTLIDDRLDLDLDDVAVNLLYVGPAHTSGDIVAYLPAQGVVFTGDILFRLCSPIGWEGTYAKWIGALDRLIELKPAIVVPGHGPLCDVEGLREMKSYLVYVRDESKRFFEAEMPALEAAKRIDLGPYAAWTQPERIVFNVERAYRELRGEPYDAPIDAARLFRDMLDVRQTRQGSPS